jgi:hypothetical protein
VSAVSTRTGLCMRGHRLDKSRVTKNGRVKRYCLECARMRGLRMRLRKKAPADVPSVAARSVPVQGVEWAAECPACGAPGCNRRCCDAEPARHAEPSDQTLTGGFPR